MLWVVDNLLLDHVGLPQVVIVAVHLVFFLLDGFRGSSWDMFTKGTLLSECSFMVKSWVWVVGGWWPRGLYCHLLGLRIGVLSISIPIFPFQIPHPHPHPNPKSPIPGPGPVPVPVAWQYDRGSPFSVYDNSLDCSLPHILKDGLTHQLGRGSCQADENKIRHLLLRIHQQLLLSEFCLILCSIYAVLNASIN